MEEGPEIITFGCRLNSAESEAIRQYARRAGLADALIVNTCAVTAEAERQARQAIRRGRRERPSARIIVTGCAAQIRPDLFAAMPEVDHVLDNAAKMRGASWDTLAAPVPLPARPEPEGEGSTLAPASSFEGKWRGFVQVQNGCDHACTFCVIPLGRGASRSVPLGPVVEQARALVANGYREIVLTGVDLTAWGEDLPGRPRLGALIRRLLALVPELPRLRLSSLDPVEVDESFWDVWATEPRLMPHLHLSLQAGHDLILKRMKRRHGVAEVEAFCARARRLRPDVAFGADLIAGFPTEDDAMARATLELVERLGLVWLHVFPYSARSGTPAARMPQVPGAARRDRAARLREAGERAAIRHLESLVGRRLEVLVEGRGLGCAPDFSKMTLPEEAVPGSVVMARITGRDGLRLVAELDEGSADA